MGGAAEAVTEAAAAHQIEIVGVVGAELHAMGAADVVAQRDQPLLNVEGVAEKLVDRALVPVRRADDRL